MPRMVIASRASSNSPSAMPLLLSNHAHVLAAHYRHRHGKFSFSFNPAQELLGVLAAAIYAPPACASIFYRPRRSRSLLLAEPLAAQRAALRPLLRLVLVLVVLVDLFEGHALLVFL